MKIYNKNQHGSFYTFIKSLTDNVIHSTIIENKYQGFTYIPNKISQRSKEKKNPITKVVVALTQFLFMHRIQWDWSSQVLENVFTGKELERKPVRVTTVFKSFVDFLEKRGPRSKGFPMYS